MTAPTGRASEILNFPPELPPRPATHHCLHFRNTTVNVQQGIGALLAPPVGPEPLAQWLSGHCDGASLLLHVPALRRRKTEVVRYIVKMYLAQH